MFQNLCDVFFSTVERHGGVAALLDEHAKPPVSMTYAGMAAQVRALGAGLLALGIAPGDRVALLSDNRPRWIVTNLAILGIGAVSVPRGSDSTSEELWYILNHSEARAAFVQDRRTLDRLTERVLAESALRLLILMDDSATESEEVRGIGLVNFSAVQAAAGEDCAAFDEARQRVQPTQRATIVYTSGTTGIPKGVVLTHANLCHQAENIELGVGAQPGDMQIAILPAWHVYEQVCEYYAMSNAATLVYTDKRWFRDDLARHRPHNVPCVPRIWESVYDAIFDKIRKSSAPRRRLVQFLLAASHAHVRARRVAQGLDAWPQPASRREKIRAAIVSAACAPLHRLGDAIVYSKIRAITGGRMRAAVSGGGSFPMYLDDFFEVIGIRILNGYGLTETSPLLSFRTGPHNVRGTVGRPIAHTQLCVRDEAGNDVPQGATGVIHARGPQIMQGYYRNEEATRAVIDADGWFNTGDLGWFTCRGDLVITGRAKDTIVLLGGENVEPEPIETCVRRSRFVTQIVVVGQDRKSPGALVAPDVPALAAALDLPAQTPAREVIGHPLAARTVRDDIAAIMKHERRFRSYEQIARICLIEEPFSEANGTLTKTFKPKRNVILKQYAHLIDAMYARQ